MASFFKNKPITALFSNPIFILSVDKYWDFRCTNTNNNEPQSLTELELPFTQDELVSYTEHRKTGLAKKSLQWLEKASHLFWLHTEGVICKENLDKLRQYVGVSTRLTGLKVKSFHLL